MKNKKIKIDTKIKELALTVAANYSISIDKSAEVVITESIEPADGEVKIELMLEPGAKVIYRINQTAPSVNRVAEVGKDASINWQEVQLSNQSIKSSITNNLIGEGAQAYINGIYFGNENQIIDLSHSNRHLASHTKSDILTKGVLNDKAKTNYRGLVKVASGAAGCQGYEKQETLILSDQAEVIPVPDLEIANNDVKCSHGVTVSHLDEDKLFYLKSRGLNQKLATYEFVNAFLNSAGFELDELAQKIINQKIS